MKYSKEEASQVIYMFERYLNQNITINKYYTDNFFHVFCIAPITIKGVTKTSVRFKDMLVDECIDTEGNILDIENYINVCFS